MHASGDVVTADVFSDEIIYGDIGPPDHGVEKEGESTRHIIEGFYRDYSIWGRASSDYKQLEW